MKPNSEDLVVGLNIPARVGMSLDEVATPALLVDLDAFEQNVRVLRERLQSAGVRLRAHAKTHKSVDIARYQIKHGGACGVCCQKVAEAESMVTGDINDVMVSNQVVDPDKIDRLARLATRARILLCVDDRDNIDTLSAAALKHEVTLECLVEIDCGAGRCGVAPGPEVVELAQAIAQSHGLEFAGIQAFQGSAQHIRDYSQRGEAIASAAESARECVALLQAANLDCAIVAGAGTGSYYFEAASGIYNEMQCGSYIFMDADYGRVLNVDRQPITEFKNSLFVLTSIMSKARPGIAVCDAGLKVMSAESGLPVIFARDDIKYREISDEHGVIDDPQDNLALNQKLKLIPGHCDPTCNLHDWYVGIRNDKVECLWPISARGMAF